MKRYLSGLFVASLIGVAPALAEFQSQEEFELNPIFEAATLAFEPVKMPKGLHGLYLTIGGPRNYQAQIKLGTKLPKIELKEFGDLYDGAYSYSVTGATKEEVEINVGIDRNGRDQNERRSILRSVSYSGRFVVEDGKIVTFKDIKEE